VLDTRVVEQTPARRWTRAKAAPKAEPSEWAKRVRLALSRRKRLLIALCAVLLVLVTVRATWSGASGATLEEALATVVARDGVRVDPSTVSWLDEDDGPLFTRGAIFLGQREGELADLYYADVRPGGARTALDVAFLTNLTSTASAEETQLVQNGTHVAFATKVGERFDAVMVLDTRGEPAALTEGWPFHQRLQNDVTNVQETGRAVGLGQRRYQLAIPAERLRLARAGEGFVARVGRERLVLDPDRERPREGAALVEVQPQSKGRPGVTGWAVDTVRNVSWIGPEPIEWLENRVFAVKDALTRGWHWAFGPPDTAAEVAEDLAMAEPTSESARQRRAMLTVTDPEMGWPPRPLEPVIAVPAVEGEGGWIPIVDDPFVNATPNAPPPFYQTFLRADPEREFTRVYITLWDPRQVQLRMQAGTVEPQSATGQRGTGRVPRDPETLRDLVGAFNGGFQALHGEFGMMADDRVYLPPKPWAATVAVFDDGRVGIGSWPAPDWRGAFYDEDLANRQIPETMVDFRQNLTSVVEDGVWNPWGRWYWGAAPRNAEEQTLTTRSGLCITEEGFTAYFWCQGIGPDALATAMIRTRCTRAIHLDMNISHAGFEFFRPYAPGEARPPLGRSVRGDAEFDGAFPDADGWHLRARRAVRSMQMPFPRYASRDGRDFFYLTLRRVLPGPNVGGVELSTAGLPHAGWPHAFARAQVGGAWIVRIDPRRAVPSPIRRDDHRRALAHLSSVGTSGDRALVARRLSVGHRFVIGEPEPGDVVLASGPALDGAPGAQVALGVDRDGFLVYAERTDGAGSLAPALREAGVSEAIVLPQAARLGFVVRGGHAGPDGYEREVPESGSLAFFAEERPATEVMFPDNTPIPYREWRYLQDQRVRYFPEGPPRFVSPRDVEE
jgi:hypothetical protein